MDVPLSLYHDAGDYLRSTVGKTEKGCDAYTTSFKTGEHLYVGKCDTERLGALRFNIQEALEFNRSLPMKQRIVESCQYHMIDYASTKQQALFCYTSNHCLAHIIMDEAREFIHFRLDSDIPRLKDIDIPLDARLEQADKLPENYRIIPELKDLRYFKDVRSRRQNLIGKNPRSMKTVILFDVKGKIPGYQNQDR